MRDQANPESPSMLTEKKAGSQAFASVLSESLSGRNLFHATSKFASHVREDKKDQKLLVFL